jgi:hypothetical protein
VFTGAAFATKAGIHASAIMKEPATYEHVVPETVGNRRRVLVSDQAGKANHMDTNLVNSWGITASSTCWLFSISPILSTDHSSKRRCSRVMPAFRM